MIQAVMKKKRFCGMGSTTCISIEAFEKRRELMLTRQGKIIRGKLTTTEIAKPKRVTCEIKLNEKLDRMSPFTVSVQKDTYPNKAT